MGPPHRWAPPEYGARTAASFRYGPRSVKVLYERAESTLFAVPAEAATVPRQYQSRMIAVQSQQGQFSTAMVPVEHKCRTNPAQNQCRTCAAPYLCSARAVHDSTVAIPAR